MKSWQIMFCFKYLIILIFGAVYGAADVQDNDLILSFHILKEKNSSYNVASLKVSRNRTMAGVYDDLATLLTKKFADDAAMLIKAFPSKCYVFEPLDYRDFILSNAGKQVLNCIDVVADTLQRRTDPYWGDRNVQLYINLTESGVRKIGWLSPFAKPNFMRQNFMNKKSPGN